MRTLILKLRQLIRKSWKCKMVLTIVLLLLLYYKPFYQRCLFGNCDANMKLSYASAIRLLSLELQLIGLRP